MDQYLRIKLAFFHASELSDVENGLAWTPLGPQLGRSDTGGDKKPT